MNDIPDYDVNLCRGMHIEPPEFEPVDTDYADALEEAIDSLATSASYDSDHELRCELQTAQTARRLAEDERDQLLVKFRRAERDRKIYRNWFLFLVGAVLVRLGIELASILWGR